jgi:hypothetical protein
MGEFWVRDLHPRLMYYQDVRGAASAAHVYGKPLVAAESFTGGGYERIHSKKVADYWVPGHQPFVFHTSASATDTGPETRWSAPTSTATSLGQSRHGH